MSDGMGASATPPGDWERATGYSDAFYQLGKMLGISAQDKSPAQVWHDQMRPLVTQRLAEHSELLEALRWFVGDERFQVSVGGNPDVVERMIADAQAVYAKATGADAPNPSPDNPIPEGRVK